MSSPRSCTTCPIPSLTSPPHSAPDTQASSMFLQHGLPQGLCTCWKPLSTLHSTHPCPLSPLLCSALLFRWLSVQGRSRNSQSILRATHPRGTSSREPQTDTLRAPRPRPRQAARSVTHLLARLGRRVVTGCGAGCSCHGVGQILGRSIRLGVIHHLRTTHGSRGSGGPGAAAAAL